jgi:Mce-associated membrane protein
MTDHSETPPIPVPIPVPEPAAEPVPEPASEPADRADKQPETGPNLHDTPPEPALAPPAAKRIFDRRMILLGVGSGIAAVVVVLVALMLFAPSAAPLKVGAVADAARARQSEAVEKVATRFATSLYSFNYQTIDADLDRIRDDSTGGFSRELETVLGEVDVFKKAIVDARGQSSGEVEGVDVREIRDGTATARVFVVQSIQNKKNPQPREQFSAVELTLVRTSGGWKVDDVQQFQAGASGAAEGQ